MKAPILQSLPFTIFCNQLEIRIQTRKNAGVFFHCRRFLPPGVGSPSRCPVPRTQCLVRCVPSPESRLFHPGLRSGPLRGLA